LQTVQRTDILTNTEPFVHISASVHFDDSSARQIEVTKTWFVSMQ